MDIICKNVPLCCHSLNLKNGNKNISSRIFVLCPSSHPNLECFFHLLIGVSQFYRDQNNQCIFKFFKIICTFSLYLQEFLALTADFQTAHVKEQSKYCKKWIANVKEKIIPSVLPCTKKKKSSVIINGITSHSANKRSEGMLKAILQLYCFILKRLKCIYSSIYPHPFHPPYSFYANIRLHLVCFFPS